MKIKAWIEMGGSELNFFDVDKINKIEIIIDGDRRAFQVDGVMTIHTDDVKFIRGSDE